jgi:hypothetical protein
VCDRVFLSVSSCEKSVILTPVLIMKSNTLSSFANANVLLVLGELMGGDEDGQQRRSAIPLIAAAIVTAQVTRALATVAGNRMTGVGIGRKPLFMAGLLTLPIRCALIILWKNAGDNFLLSTQVLDGLGGGFFGLIHPVSLGSFKFATKK